MFPETVSTTHHLAPDSIQLGLLLAWSLVAMIGLTTIHPAVELRPSTLIVTQLHGLSITVALVAQPYMRPDQALIAIVLSVASLLFLAYMLYRTARAACAA